MTKSTKEKIIEIIEERCQENKDDIDTSEPESTARLYEKMREEYKRKSSYKMEEVVSPAHYRRPGLAVEVVDIVEAFDLPHHLANVVQYILRHEMKGGVTDLEKAKWWLDRYLNLVKKND